MEDDTLAVLNVTGLIKSYGRRRVVDGVSFEVHKGEIVGLLGPNGAGKTTFIRLVTGFLIASGGSLTVDGLSPARDWR